MSFKEKIIKQALDSYNEKGIEYFGMRELAKSLEVKLGNITYYFPKKDDLIYAIWKQLSQKNSTILDIRHSNSIIEYLNMIQNYFRNQYQYRCLFLSFVHLLKQNSIIKDEYKAVEHNRMDFVKRMIFNLIDKKYLKELSDEEIFFLVSAKSLIFRFWISESEITFNHLSVEQKIRNYQKVIINLLLPFCLKKAKSDINNFFN